MLSKQVTAAAIAAVFASLASNVHGHGHLVSPRSRNYVAKQDGQWWPADGTTPYPETCSHCLNIGGTEARCGKVDARDYDYPKSSNGLPLAPAIQACYAEGDVVQLDVVLTAHHMGHFSYKACAINTGEVASQECFDSNPLTFVEDVLYGSLPDPNYPNRAYIPRTDSALIQKDNGGDYMFSHRFRLPEALSGELVLLQWHYITANSCMSDDGYLNYDFPAGFEPNYQVGVCESIPPDGRGVPEQFWNCAEIRISSACAGNEPPPSPPTTPPPPTTTQATTTTTQNTGATTTATTTTTTSTSVSPPPPSSCPAVNSACGPNNPCSNGMCCSQWGYCGTTEAYCGECCQSNCSGQPPSPPSPSPPPPSPPTSNPPPTSGFNYNADHGEDSRLIAYVGNWQACPTDEQIDAYSHIVIAFAVSYTWSPGKNNCDSECQVSSSLPLCGNQARPDLIDKWRGMGKKVIMSFGGAGMGGSWSGDSNNCWDYCFGNEERLSTDLVNMIDAQNLDGIDIDYEYCYDVAGKQAGRCGQRSGDYSDAAAQLFLNSMTSLLRTKLDSLQASNGYSRGRYEVTHAPMDTDLVSDSKYFEILHERRADLDFLMPQFYNGYTRAGVDGFDGTGAGQMTASSIYSSLANDMFDNEPNKVVFGHCISDCSGTGSNVNANQAVQIQQEIKAFNNGEFECNGGAFFWVATHDVGGEWSDTVVSEVSLSAGCSNSQTTSSTSSSTTTTTTTTTTTATEPPPSPPTTPPPPTTTQATTTSTTTSSVSPPPPPPPSSCPAVNSACGPNNPCSNGMCCSQWGYCGTTEAYCGECCQSNCSGQPPSPPSPSPPPPSPPTSNPPPTSGFNYNADHGEDSRLIAYVGNWQACPTDEQIDAYSHIVIAFAVSYTWSPGKNNCDSECQVSSSLPLCGNQARPDLIDKWRGMGKKVIMSFGGAGMGGSWSGDSNNCWDYCFGNEERLSTDLVNMIDAQNLDGIDIDYEYCYDVAGKQAGRCGQRSGDYSDAAAQLFLNSMTSLLRTKLDSLQASNGYSRGRYEVTHAPMDTDLVSDSKYFEILHERRADLDFLMPQFYNGYTRAGVDGFDGTGAGQMTASSIYSSLANDMFDNEPNKVVFGHCISDCSGTGSNVNANQAVQIQQEIKSFNNGEFECNGGAFFWVATHDVGGGWSDAVVSEVSLSAGCSNSQTTSSTSSSTTTTTTTTTSTTTTTVTPAPSKAPTSPPNPEPTTSMPTPEPSSLPTPIPTTAQPTQAPAAVTPVPTKAPLSTPQPTGELVVDRQSRCGPSELHARETCGNVCISSADCPAGEWCWGTHTNYCGSIPKRVYSNPVQSSVWNRCGTSELDARAFCGEPCTWQCSTPGETCLGVHANYCGSEYQNDSPPTTSQPMTPAPTKAPQGTPEPTDGTPTSEPTSQPTPLPTTPQPTAAPTAVTPAPTKQPTDELVVDRQNRCGPSELHARETCGNVCVSSNDCPAGEWCWGTHANYCGSIPKRVYSNPVQSSVWTRCGTSELDARTFCGEPCTWQCSTPGETCVAINSNYCDSEYTELS